jgi:hypothetical protein
LTSSIGKKVAVDQFRHGLQARLRILNVDLWRQVRDDGQLLLSIERTEISVGSDGKQRIKTVQDTRVCARREGYRILDPALKAFEPRLARILKPG